MSTTTTFLRSSQKQPTPQRKYPCPLTINYRKFGCYEVECTAMLRHHCLERAKTLKIYIVKEKISQTADSMIDRKTKKITENTETLQDTALAIGVDI